MACRERTACTGCRDCLRPVIAFQRDEIQRLRGAAVAYFAAKDRAAGIRDWMRQDDIAEIVRAESEAEAALRALVTEGRTEGA